MTSPTLKELQEQLVNVNLQIQIEEKRMHGEAVTTVRELVRRFELTPEEVFDQATPTRKNGAVKAKYRDPAEGVQPSDKDLRDKVARALGCGTGTNYAWSYLLKQIESLVECEEDLIALKKSTHPTPQGLDADMFWDADDPERCESSINNVVVEVDSYRGLKVGDIVTIQRAARLPDLEVRVTQVPDAEGNGDLEWDVIDAAQAKQGV